MSVELFARLDREMGATHSRIKDLEAEYRSSNSAPPGLVKALVRCRKVDLVLTKKTQDLMIVVEVQIELDSIETGKMDHAGTSFRLMYPLGQTKNQTPVQKYTAAVNELKCMGFTDIIMNPKNRTPKAAIEAIAAKVQKQPTYFLLSTSTKLGDNGDPYVNVMGPADASYLKDQPSEPDDEPDDEPAPEREEITAPKRRTTKTKQAPEPEPEEDEPAPVKTKTKNKTKQKPAPEELDVGSRIVWNVGGVDYPGEIDEDKGDKWHINFDDGDDNDVEKDDDTLRAE